MPRWGRDQVGETSHIAAPFWTLVREERLVVGNARRLLRFAGVEVRELRSAGERPRKTKADLIDAENLNGSDDEQWMVG
jgi:hypothetical protein